jgi:NitT/TauT family transport system permease protein
MTDTAHETTRPAGSVPRPVPQRTAKPRRKMLRLLSPAGPTETIVLGVLGAAALFVVWQIAHYAMPETSRRFLPSPFQVIATLWMLIAEREFLNDAAISAYRIFASFFAACLIAVPLGVLMGCFGRLKALINPTVSAWRYLPAASFVPLLLVWFGPTDTQKLALLFMGVIFFLVALILDSTEAVPKELVEAAMTMGASRREIVVNVVGRAALPGIIDAMRNMIAVGWTYLVIAEIVAAQDGIGAVMMRAGRFLNVDVIMAGILAIGILGVLTDLAFRGAAWWLMPWNRKRKG